MNLFDDNKVQEEVDIYLSSLEDKEPEVLQTIHNFQACAKIINNSVYPETILSFLNQYYKTGLLSPLKLDDTEFTYNGEADWVNKRYDNILLNPDDDIIYRSAWTPRIIHVYDPINNEEVPIFPDYIDLTFRNVPLWITRGGCCKGEYISEIKLKQEIVDNHSFIPPEPIIIPVSVILNEKCNIFSVDAREPALRLLRKNYNTVETVIDYKFDIRKFKKLNKYG